MANKLWNWTFGTIYLLASISLILQYCKFNGLVSVLVAYINGIVNAGDLVQIIIPKHLISNKILIIEGLKEQMEKLQICPNPCG